MYFIVGVPDVGKTHLATTLGLEDTKRRRVKFINAEELTNLKAKSFLGSANFMIYLSLPYLALITA